MHRKRARDFLRSLLAPRVTPALQEVACKVQINAEACLRDQFVAKSPQIRIIPRCFHLISNPAMLENRPRACEKTALFLLFCTALKRALPPFLSTLACLSS